MRSRNHLKFAGFLIFHSPLKPDAIDALKMLADSSHEFVVMILIEREATLMWSLCIMITGDNPLTAIHVARDVEIVDREALILDLKENPAHEMGKVTSPSHFESSFLEDLEWRTVDETKIIPVNPTEPFDQSLLDNYDICVTGLPEAVRVTAKLEATCATYMGLRTGYRRRRRSFIVTSLRELGYTILWLVMVPMMSVHSAGT